VSQWVNVCSEDDLQPDSGICALVEDKQVAIFYLARDKEVYATNNYDPFGKANVLSRGLIGDIKGEPMVSSPLYKQHFSLKTGVCFDDDSIVIETYGVRIEKNQVEVNIKVSSNEI
jgi:NAD(P)H-dependent nitrite reductase small subunit